MKRASMALMMCRRALPSARLLGARATHFLIAAAPAAEEMFTARASPADAQLCYR